MTSVLRLLFAAICALPLSAAAGDTLHWRCWYDQQVHITCIVDSVPEQGATAGALPANLPPIVKALRQDPGAFRKRLLHIPLHTEPDDMQFTALLAKATVCGARHDCTVNFTATLASPAEIIALLGGHPLAAYRGDSAAAELAYLDSD